MKRRERHKMVSKRGFIWLKTFHILISGLCVNGTFSGSSRPLKQAVERTPAESLQVHIAANISERKRSLLSWLGTCLQTSTQEGIRPGIETLPLLLPQLLQLHQPCTPLLPPCPPPPSPPSPPNPLQRLPQKKGWLPTQANWRNIWR